MKELRKSMVLIGLGVMNLLHAGLHILQFIQSMILIRASSFGPKIDHVDKNLIDTMLHSPYFAVLWAIVGSFTLWIGIKDFIHHGKCNH